jgi:hypothetical protein
VESRDIEKAMPPARTTSVGSGKTTRPFKPPSRLSNASAGSATVRRTPADQTAQGHSGSGFATSTTHGSMLASDEDLDDMDDMESEEEPHVAAKKTRPAIGKRKSTGAPPTTPRRRSTAVAAGAEDDPLALIEDDEDVPTIPRPLLTRILFEGFQDKNVKIGKEAMNLVELYTRIFVKEAVARSKLATKEQAQRMNGRAAQADWLQVEDLEKIAPQLILDF